MKIRILQSLLVCSIILWKSSLLRVEWISGCRSWLASRIQGCVWCLAFTRHMRSCVFRYVGNPRIESSRIRCWRRRCWIYKNVSRYMCVRNAWRLVVAARHSYRKAQHSTRIWMRWEKHWLTGNVGWSTAYWLGFFKISRIIQTINFILWFLNSGREFQDRVLIFVQSFSRKFIECGPLKSLQFLYLIETFHMRFTKIPIWQLFLKLWLISPGLVTPCYSMINFHSLRINNSSWFLETSFIRLGLKFVLLDLRENTDLLVFKVATWLPFLRRIWTWFVHGSPRTCTCAKGLSWQQIFFMRVISLSTARWFFSLLSERWWR